MRIAAIDVGSNSMRVAVLDVGATGLLRVIEEERAARRLIRDVTRLGRFADATITETLEIIADFLAIADAAGAERSIAVATSAVRDATNGHELVVRAHEELDLDLLVVDGAEEARLTFLGATHSLPVRDGMVLDIGGGSLEIAQFRDRALLETWSFPLGAVRLSDEFPMSEPPSKEDIKGLRQYVRETVAASGVPALEPGEVLIGTGGAIRNLSKVSAEATSYPLPRLHGHALSREDLREVRDLLCAVDVERRAGIAGLNSDRADSIVAGAIAAEVTAEYVGATQLTVSGQGMREGIALAAFSDAQPDLATIRAGSVARMQETFAPRWIEYAQRRARVVEALRVELLPELDSDLASALEAAAALMDLGRNVDYYRRGRHTESLLLAHGLPGYSHREVAATCALIRRAEQEKFSVGFYTPLLTENDSEAMAQASALLAAAEDIARRAIEGSDSDWRVTRKGEAITVSGPIAAHARPSAARRRLNTAFGIELCIEPSDGADR